MYARYIPPPKAKSQAAPPAPPPAPPVEEVSTPPVAPAQATGRTALTPYARYIPPKKKAEASPAAIVPAAPVVKAAPPAQPQKIVFNFEADDVPTTALKPRSYSPDIEHDGDGERRRKRAKTEPEAPEKQEKIKKTKKDRRLNEDDAAVESTEPQPSDPVLPPAPTSPIEVKAVSEEVKDEKPGGDRQEIRKAKKEKKEKKESKEKKEKKEKKKKKSKSKDEKETVDGDVDMKDAADIEVEEEPVDTRHKAVLLKKEKSLQKSLASQAEPEKVDPGPLGLPTTEGIEARGLEPLPQPAPAIIDTSEPSYDTLPPWLAKPVQVSPDTRAGWTTLGLKPELGISQAVAKHLASKGYEEAFAVQTAVIPRLLPSPERQGDLVISAATGSGKTLAYVLPIVRDISLGTVTQIRALVVVPTRELVRQVHEACELCAAAFAGPGNKRVKIGTAVGNQAFKREQLSLMDQELRYDPAGYRRLVEARELSNLRRREHDEPDFDMLELLDQPLPLVQHVVEYTSKVDILICTPGRLVEHIQHTPGFTLDYVRWLVVDEADKLLEQSFQQWLDVVTEKLATEKFAGIRDFPMQNKSGVRKIVLSATMTRNVGLLGGLRLRRPELIVLDGGAAAVGNLESGTGDGQENQQPHSLYELALPELLREAAIKVRDPEQKPLYLVDLLQREHMRSNSGHSQTTPPKTGRPVGDAKAKPSDESDTSSSGSDSDSDSDSDTSSSGSSSDEDEPGQTDTVLIFTKSNETALRLSRLMEMLLPASVATTIGTMTSTTRTSERKKILKAFGAGRVRIVVASDLVARGLDLPHLDHVVNYDMPPSVRAYVHRVGRTARAGRAGRAWTLFTKSEAGWFFAEVAGQQKHGSKRRSAAAASGSTSEAVPIRRAGKVETVRVTERRSSEEKESSGVAGDFSEERLAEYERALGALGKEARESR